MNENYVRSDLHHVGKAQQCVQVRLPNPNHFGTETRPQLRELVGENRGIQLWMTTLPSITDAQMAMAVPRSMP